MRRFAFGLLGVVLLAGGCSAPESGVRSLPAAPPGQSASPSPNGTADKGDLVAALNRVHVAPFRFAVNANLPESANVTASGAFDLASKLFEATTNQTGGKNPGKNQRIVVGVNDYLRQGDDKSWVHLDLSRIKNQNSPVYFDMNDPTGLVKFTTTIRSARRTSPTTYTGTYDPFVPGREFLPIGAPALWTIGGGTQPFTVTTDDQGRVVSIQVEFASSNGNPKLVMTTTLSEHGKPLPTKAPAKGSVREAASFYYD